MAEETTNNSPNTANVGSDILDKDLDDRIEQARKMQSKLRGSQDELGETPTGQTSSKEKASKDDIPDDDGNQITVERDYIHSLREEAKGFRKEKEELRKETEEMKKILADYFNVTSAQALKEKLEDERKAQDREEEGRLSKIELAEKKAKHEERKREEERIKYEQEKKSLTQQRDKIIIQNALIQAAVANDVANPRQLLKLLENEFFVDPERLVPYYKAEDGMMTLEERVKVFLEEPENWNLVTSKIAAGSGTKGSQSSSSGKRTYTKKELSELRHKDPAEYKRLQPDIMAAYREGRVQ